MTGYMMVIGNCWACGFPFTFNADLVPSLTVNGRREPICETCMGRANAQREANGLPPHPILPGAYEAQAV